MKVIRTLKNYFFYCGIEKDEYNVLKKDAYIANFRTWRILHYLMAAVFGGLFISALYSDLMGTNRIVYLGALAYSVLAVICFHVMKEDSILAQLMIYLSISLLFVFACLITANKPELPATTFIVFLLVSSMFMIDKPFFMALELIVASGVFLVWMRAVKPLDVWEMDLANVIPYTIVSIFLNIIANSIRIKEFVLTRQINLQKDTDELTGLNNKGALIRKVNAFLAEEGPKGAMFLFDVDRFKAINDTHGHDIGDLVIARIGEYLRGRFTGGEIVGRFGGDEFIVFSGDADNEEKAGSLAEEIIRGISGNVTIEGADRKVSVSIGISFPAEGESDYAGVFKRADIALYKAKAETGEKYCIH